MTKVLVNGTPPDPEATYTAAMNYYIAYVMGANFSPAGNWNVTVTIGPADIDALIAYIGSLPAPLEVGVDGRIVRLG